MYWSLLQSKLPKSIIFISYSMVNESPENISYSQPFMSKHSRLACDVDEVSEYFIWP